jgi:hypothetical protein
MSWPALNQAVCALRSLYGVTLRQADLPERIAYAREPQELPGQSYTSPTHSGSDNVADESCAAGKLDLF